MSEQLQTTSSTPVSTHESSTPAGTATAPTTKAPKDRTCPFCHTPYTASSLGRHLDTYIRPNNPKPEDGIHIPEKIRELRHGITRRNMREKVNSKRSSSTAQSRNVSAEKSKPPASKNVDEDMDDDESQMSPIISAPVQKLNHTDGGEILRWRINELSWHDTGVIKDLPPRSMSAASNARRDLSKSKHHMLKSDFENRQKVADELDTASAADMALKEVLARVKEASARSLQAGMFDFDPYQLNFPALCLKILPPPPTLGSPTPFPTNDSWSLAPPGMRQWESLQRAVKDRLVSYQRALSSSSPLLTQPPYEVDVNRLRHHLQDAYVHWVNLPEAQKQETWQLEILRSYSHAEEGRKDLQNKLDITIKENEELRKELERMRQTLEDDGVNRGREISRISSVPPISPKTVQELWKLGFDSRQWEYEPLIEKWKAAMREQKQNANGMAAQRRLSAAPAATVTSKTPRSTSRAASLREEALSSAAGTKKQPSAPRSRPKKAAKKTTKPTEVPTLQQGQSGKPDAHPEVVEMQEQPHFQAMQEQHVPPPPQRSPRPPTPQMHTHLSAQPVFNDQRRGSLQLSPHSMPNQQRRGSTQYQMSPQSVPTPQQQAHNMSRQASQMLQYPQPPLLQMPQTGVETQPLSEQSQFATQQSLQQQSMQNWMPPHPQQPSHQQPHTPVQSLTPVSVTIPDQTQFSQPAISDAQFQNLGLQVPHNDGRRNSHPMIDPGQHVEMQGVEAPVSAGPYITPRMPMGMEGMTMGYVNTGMGIVNSAGGRVG